MDFLSSVISINHDDYGGLIYWTFVFLCLALCLIVCGHLRLLIRSKCQIPVRVMAVLGSGGHTREMLSIMQSLSPAVFKERIYVYSKHDDLSKLKAEELEESTRTQFTIKSIHRSRQVGQSFFTSIFTTAYSMIGSFLLVLKTRPDVIICNGPGVCVPIIYSAVFLKFLGLFKPRIIFVESICRVKSLTQTILITSFTKRQKYFGTMGRHAPTFQGLYIYWPNLLKITMCV